ncbi:MAG TPA: hypothetical protein VER55_02110, partial [Ardenticatenaceae bacterium]|nr:hypothetical protein [Ardenticatenaceae bacterium]
AICGFLAIFLSRTEEVIGTVESASWTRTVQIEGLVAVEHEDWHDEIPSEGIVAECTQRVRRTQDEPEPGAREVCGTPYTVDGGDGFGEVVQDCKYEVYDDWCTYTVDEWQRVDTASVSGGDLNPYWPALQLGVDQREGQRGEQYECIFTAGDATYTYSTSSEAEFAQCEAGTRWVLNVNPLGGVRSIEPAR